MTISDRNDEPVSGTGANFPLSPVRRALVLSVFMGLMVVNLLDRQIVAILAEPMRLELGLSDSQIGILSGLVFAIFYSTFALPIGRLADRYDRVYILSAAAAGWSLMTAACGLAGNFIHLALARIGVAVGEAGGVPPAHSLISDYFPPERRARAIAIMQLGAPIGVFLALVAGGWIAENYGWRNAFIIVAIPGLFVAIAALLVLPEPRRHSIAAKATYATDETFVRALLGLLALKGMKPILAGGVFAAFAVYSVVAWLPVFFQRIFEWSPGETGAILGPVIGVAGLIGTWAGGAIGDRWRQNDKGGQVRIAMLAPLFAAPLFAAGALMPVDMVALALLALPCLFYAVFQAPLAAAVQNIAPAARRALASSLFIFSLNFLGLGLGPTSVGFLSDFLHTSYGDDSLRYALLLVPAAGLASAAFLWLGYRALRQA